MSDSWCQEVSSLPDPDEAGGGGTVSISHCISCHFKSSVLETKHLFTLPTPEGASSSNLASSVADDDLQEPGSFGHVRCVPKISAFHMSSRKEDMDAVRSSVAHSSSNHSCSGGFLGGYFGPPYYRTKAHTADKIMQSHSPKPDVFSISYNNNYSGGLDLPQWDLVISTHGRNFQPSADHHSLADCIEPPALHGVICQQTGEKIMHHHARAGSKPSFGPQVMVKDHLPRC
jgi:hypothetical protein